MNWKILQRWKIFHFWWKNCHFGEIFSRYLDLRVVKFHPKWKNLSTLVDNFPLPKKIIPKSHELDHSAQKSFFRKIGNFSTFSENSKILQIYLFGPIAGQSFSEKYFLKKWASKQWDFEQKIPIFKLEIGFFSNFLKKNHYFRKFGNFICFGLHVCQVSAKSKKLFFFIHHSSFIIHHSSS